MSEETLMVFEDVGRGVLYDTTRGAADDRGLVGALTHAGADRADVESRHQPEAHATERQQHPDPLRSVSSDR